MIARHVIARLLETFFRRWWLYILPLVAMIGLGIYTAGNKADAYHSVAVLSAADETLLDELQGASRTDTLAFESPADATARRINEALRTDEFVRVVRDAAGVPADSLLVTIEDVRRDVWASSGGGKPGDGERQHPRSATGPESRRLDDQHVPPDRRRQRGQ